MLAFPLAASVAAGCDSGRPASPEAEESGTTRASSGAVTYYRDVKPIVDAKCVTCHTAGSIAPFPLVTFDDVAAKKLEIVDATSKRLMPPWPPSDTCASYQGDLSLSDAQIATLAAWVSSGATPGEAEDFHPLGGARLGLSRVDLESVMPEAYTPTQRPDDYHCFLLDWTPTTTKFVTGFGTVPGEPSLVHHALVYVVPPAQVAAYRAFDDAEPGAGYTCFGGPNPKSADPIEDPDQIGGWVPGVTGIDYPEGTGIRVEPGSKIVLQVHYNTLRSPPAPDRTRLQMKLADAVDHEAYVMAWADPDWPAKKTMRIPAGEADVKHEFAFDGLGSIALATNLRFTVDRPVLVHDVALHMHLLGTHAKLDIQRANGQDDACLLDIPSWSFHWQAGYRLAQPVLLERDDKLHIECHWDNSGRLTPSLNGDHSPPVDVNWGNGTTDEMCVGFLYVTQP